MNVNALLDVVKNHELVILSGKEFRQLIGVRRLDKADITELHKELDKAGYVLITIKHGYRHEVRRIIIVRKDTYVRIVKERDRYAIARVVIDYVLSNRQLFAVNVKNNNGVLRIPTPIVKKLLKRIGLDNHYLNNHINAIVLAIRALLEAMGFKTTLKKARGKSGSVIYVFENGSDGGSRVPEAGERLLNPPGESQPGGGHVGNGSNPGSNPESNPNSVPGSGEVREDKEEGAGHEEQQDTSTRPNGVMGTTSGVRTSVCRKGRRHSGDKAQNHKGGRSRTNEEA